MLDAHAPGLVALAAQGQHVAADVDEGVGDAVGLENGSGAIERVALAVAAQVELHRGVAAGHPAIGNGQVGHRRVGAHQLGELGRIGPHGHEGVGVEAPQGR